MNNFFKLAFMTAPVLALVIYLSFFKVQEHTVRMEKESSAFDRDWNEGMSKFKGADTGELKARASAAEKELNSLSGEVNAAKDKTKRIGKNLDSAVDQAGHEASVKEINELLKKGSKE